MVHAARGGPPATTVVGAENAAGRLVDEQHLYRPAVRHDIGAGLLRVDSVSDDIPIRDPHRDCRGAVVDDATLPERPSAEPVKDDNGVRLRNVDQRGAQTRTPPGWFPRRRQAAAGP